LRLRPVRSAGAEKGGLMGKPHRETIRRALPLSQLATRGGDPITCCAVCGRWSPEMGLWRECDERDQPIGGAAAMVFIGADHPSCMDFMQKHPRLYIEQAGDPGTFPRLCGACTWRRGAACTHPDLRSNGGQGLEVVMDNAFLAGGIVCVRPGTARPIRHAVECKGRQVPGGREVATP
jgi:hypothetical protein